MQYKIKFLVCVFGLMGIVLVRAELPALSQACIQLKNIFSERELEKMCSIQKDGGGFPEWGAAFSTIQKSHLSFDQKGEAYVNLIAIAIRQTDPGDLELNERIEYRLNGIKRLEKVGFHSKICSFDELKAEFESRSNPPSGAASDKSSESDIDSESDEE